MGKTTCLEIIRNTKARGNFRHALFDFDGTLSLIRQGWQQIMIPYFTEELRAAPEAWNLPEGEAEQTVREFVELNTGRQTIYQCMALAQAVGKLGGTALAPQAYKDEYHRRLLAHIRHRLKGLENGTCKPEEYLVPGSVALLESLRQRGLVLYLASGTDEAYVRNEAALLGLSPFFGPHIYGAQTLYKTFSKKMLIGRILAENALEGPELLGFGDGFVEIENVHEVGGFACGVASNEAARRGIDTWKRARLIEAGADIIIPDYSRLGQLEAYLF